MWKARMDKATGDTAFTEIQSTVEDNVTIYEMTTGDGDIAYFATDDNNTPNLSNGENVALICQTTVRSITYLKNIGAHVQSIIESTGGFLIDIMSDIVIDEDQQQDPYMRIVINYGR